MRRDNKFVLLLASDVATFAWVLAICIPPRPLGFAVALILGFVGGVAYRRARRIDQPLSQKERRTRAGVTIGGYSLWISGIIWAAIAFESPSVWAFTSVIIPVLGVFCYMSVRTKPALEPALGESNIDA